MADPHRYRTLIELPEYSAQIDAIVGRHSPDVIAPVLSGLLWGIASNPRAYERLSWNIRIAKSRSLNLATPRLLILFQIENEGEDNEQILLCWVQESSPIDEILEF